jgi:hypothetical protein
MPPGCLRKMAHRWRLQRRSARHCQALGAGAKRLVKPGFLNLAWPSPQAVATGVYGGVPA